MIRANERSQGTDAAVLCWCAKKERPSWSRSSAEDTHEASHIPHHIAGLQPCSKANFLHSKLQTTLPFDNTSLIDVVL